MTGIELQTIRKHLGLTQKELAARLEIAHNSLARYEMPANGGRFPVPKWVAWRMNQLLTESRR
jgi:transcriptional regulator with XRE-family HTH domain